MRALPLAALLSIAACSSEAAVREDAGQADAANTLISAHEVVLADCRSTPFSDWTVLPTATDDCPMGARSNCGTACIVTADCSERPYGRCVALATAHCTYEGGQSARMPCTRDDQCTLTDGGSCRVEFGRERTFCQYEEWRFNQLDTCVEDSDCKLAAQGRCLLQLTRTHCEYQGCLVHGDCGRDEACICDSHQHRCVPAQCRVDANCASPHTCRASHQLLGSTDGLYCTTDGDTCARDEDCAAEQTNRVCAYHKSRERWECLPQYTLGP